MSRPRGGKRDGGDFMDDLLSTDNLLAQTRKQTSMRDMKSSSTSSRQIQKSPSSTFDGAEGGGGNNGLDGCASSSSTMQAGDLDAFFSTTTTRRRRQTHIQTQTTTRQYQQHTTSTKNGVHQNDTFMDELAAFTSTPAPPSSSTSVFVHKRADASEVKNMAASSASATTNSSIDDLFGMSSDAQSSSPVETEHRKTQMTMETQPTHQDEPTLSRQQLSNEEARERNNPQRSKIMENSIDVMNEGNRKPATNTGDSEDRRANFEKSATLSASPASRMSSQQCAQKSASSVKLESLKTGIDSVAGFFKAGIRRAIGPQVVHFPRAPLEQSAPEFQEALQKDGRSETRDVTKKNETIVPKDESSKNLDDEAMLAEKFESTVKVTMEETRTKMSSNDTDERHQNKSNKRQNDLSSSDMDAFFSSAGAHSVDSSTSNSHIDLESMFNSSNNNKSMPKSNGAPPPAADDFFGTPVGGGVSSSSATKNEGAFEYNPESDEEQDGDTEERMRLRKQRHERNRARIEQALEEKRARERQAIEERAERQTLQDLIGTDIDEWGKKYGGNVRTMLANLSEVLWEDHTYKVPSMMDLMEPIKVKKSYHRALVIIHPDKVAQKGGGASQRFIADKVFDLMKDAYRDFERKELS